MAKPAGSIVHKGIIAPTPGVDVAVGAKRGVTLLSSRFLFRGTGAFIRQRVPSR